METMQNDREDVELRAALQNDVTYSHATSAIWQLAVYDTLHGGRRYANIGGRQLLEHLGSAARLTSASHVLELCCGVGDICRDLAERFGCRVSGVEWNRRQVDHARALPHPSVEFIEADVRLFDTPTRFDAIAAFDSLSLVPSLDVVLRRSASLLAPGGTLVLSDVVAGPHVTPELQRFMWELDAVVNLPAPDDYRELLTAAELRAIEIADLTHVAEASFDAIGVSLRAHEERLVRECGAADVEEWRDAVARYAGAFARRELLYVCITARA